MNSKLLRGAVLAVAFLTWNHATATILSLEPPLTIAGPGDTVALDLTIADLGDGSPLSLGAFKLEILFDPGALSYVGTVFGEELNDPLDAFTPDFQDAALSGPGVITLAEVSLIGAADLNSDQPGAFVLATLEFFVDVLPPGTFTVVDFGVVSLSDASGAPLADIDLAEAVIRNPPIDVAEPMTLLLMALGVLGILATRRGR